MFSCGSQNNGVLTSLSNSCGLVLCAVFMYINIGLAGFALQFQVILKGPLEEAALYGYRMIG